jgi:hypothetical protein
VTGVNAAWDTFGVDVKVETSMRDSAGDSVFATHPQYYHVERQITAAGNWNLVLSFGSRARQAVGNTTGNFPPEPWEVARIEEDGDGSPRRMYDGAGRLISMKVPAGLPVGANGAAFGGGGSAPTSGHVSPASDRNWVGAYVVTPATAAARIGVLNSKFGPPRITTAGLAEYTRQRDSVQFTVDADPVTGAIESMVETVGKGGVLRRWTMTYDDQPDGTAVKRQVRVETPAGHGRKWALVTVKTFSNMLFMRGAAQ